MEIARNVQKWEGYIFVDYIESADYSAKIYPEATNTIRVVSAMNPKNEPEILLSFHRFGNDRSKPVDNISSGGMFALINIETGMIGAARRKTEPKIVYSEHPDTKIQIEGVQIPNWKELLMQLKHAHACFPYYNFFAWDGVFDRDLKPWILEIN